MLSLAKEFGDMGRLAHFIAVFSGSTVESLFKSEIRAGETPALSRCDVLAGSKSRTKLED